MRNCFGTCRRDDFRQQHLALCATSLPEGHVAHDGLVHPVALAPGMHIVAVCPKAADNRLVQD